MQWDESREANAIIRNTFYGNLIFNMSTITGTNYFRISLIF